MPFAMGFHWDPTLKQLHMHVVSTDYAGSGMKKPGHWRSFCSPFFRPIEAVQRELCDTGQVAVDFDEIARLRKAPLLCPACGNAQPNLPHAKQHLAQCTAQGT